MKINKPKYSLFKNSFYAFEGLKEIIKNEKSFRNQIAIFVSLNIFLIFLSLNIKLKLLLSISLLMPLISEIINSAIERTVDLYTIEENANAKAAKDAGAAIVLSTYIFTICIWAFIFLIGFKII